MSIDVAFQVIVKNITFKARVKVFNFSKKDSITRLSLSQNLKKEFDQGVLLMAFYSFGSFEKSFWVSYNKCAGFFSKWCGKYLPKRSLIKRTCSWRDKFFVLWTLNNQAKKFLRTAYWIIRSVENITPEVGVKIFQEKPYKGKMGRNLFVKRKKKL